MTDVPGEADEAGLREQHLHEVRQLRPAERQVVIVDYTGKWANVHMQEPRDDEAKGTLSGRAIAINSIGILIAISETDHVLAPWTSVREVHFELKN